MPDARIGLPELIGPTRDAGPPPAGSVRSAMLRDALGVLRSESGHVFFNLVPDRAGAVEFTPLVGRVRLSGDVGFEVQD